MSRPLGAGSSLTVAVPDSTRAEEDLTLAGLLRFGVRHRRLILASGLLASLLVATVTLVRDRTYTSSARFMPQASKGALSQLSGLAATLGVSVPATDPGSSPEFYAELLRSRDILRRTVETRYDFVAAANDSMHGTLVTLFKVQGRTPAIRRDAAAKILLQNMELTVGRTTGTIDLKVTTPWAELSQRVTSRMIQLVSEFNLHRRQTTAGAERRFAETRVAEARDSLRVAEARQQSFLQRNRDYRNSPQLLFEFDRLDREVSMRQEVYTTLAQSYEAARIDEVRNTPVITLMEPADLPAGPDPRLTLIKGILAGLVGLGIGTFIAALRQAFAGSFGPMASPSRAGEPARRPVGAPAAESDKP